MIKPWVIYSIINAFITSFAVLNFKYLTFFSKNHMVTVAQCFVITGIVAAIYLLFNRRETINLNKDNEPKKLIIQITLFVIFALTSRYIFLKSVENCPNVGYSHLIININAIISLILAYFLFGQVINKYTFVGIILYFVGLITIVINS